MRQVTPSGLKTTVLAILAAAMVALASGPALAINLFGITLFENANDADAAAIIADPQPYRVDFSTSGDTGIPEEALKIASGLWTGRDSPASGAAGLLATARADYRHIVSALYEEGYYGGTVSITVDGHEATTLPPDADLAKPAIVAVSVTTGPRFTFGKVRIVNQAPPTPDMRDQVADPASGGLVPGRIARSGAVRIAARLAVAAWRQQGHPKAAIARQDITADHSDNQVDVTLEIDPGPAAVLGAIAVKGAKSVDAAFIARASGLAPGQDYDPDDLTRARARLVGLGTFSVVKIEEADAVGSDGALPLTITVGERKPHRIGLGATYSTTDGLGLEGFWLHRNLLGEAERLRLDAKLAGIAFPLETKQFDYYFGGTFTKPAIWTPDTDLVASLVGQRNVLTRYTETSIEGRLGVTQEVNEDLTLNFGLDAKRANFDDDAFGVRDFTVLGAYGGLVYDTRDNASDPTEGIYATLDAEPFYELNYSNAAVLLTAEARTYFGFGPDDRVVLAGRVKAGALIGPSVAETPPDKLFFAGGGGSVRGFPFRSIGVETAGGDVSGGKYLTEASLEARVKVTDVIGVVGFLDAGYVTADSFTGLGEGTRIGVGAGLRYYTGLGPLRLDVAIPINKRKDDPDYAFYLGIGQAF